MPFLWRSGSFYTLVGCACCCFTLYTMDVVSAVRIVFETSSAQRRSLPSETVHEGLQCMVWFFCCKVRKSSHMKTPCRSTLSSGLQLYCGSFLWQYTQHIPLWHGSTLPLKCSCSVSFDALIETERETNHQTCSKGCAMNEALSCCLESHLATNPNVNVLRSLLHLFTLFSWHIKFNPPIMGMKCSRWYFIRQPICFFSANPLVSL